MRVLAKGRTAAECQKDIDLKKARGWEPVADMKHDESYIGGRWLCVMEKPDEPKFNKSKFNQYCGY